MYGLIGECLQIYTEQGSSKVQWDSQWTKGINQPITWFQARFDLDHLVKEDTNGNPNTVKNVLCKMSLNFCPWKKVLCRKCPPYKMSLVNSPRYSKKNASCKMFFR